MAALEQRVALSEQAAGDIAKTLVRLEIALDRFDTRLDELDRRGMEAEQSPAGRAILARFSGNESIISVHGHRLEELEEWKAELQGAFNLVRLALGTSIVAAIIGAIAIFESLTHRI